jgi:hypothetical protein
MYSQSANVRLIAGAVGLGITDIPMLAAPDLQSIAGMTVFVAGLVVFAFLLAVLALAGYMYYVRAFRKVAVPETGPVWLRTFDDNRTAEFDAIG